MKEYPVHKMRIGLFYPSFSQGGGENKSLKKEAAASPLLCKVGMAFTCLKAFPNELKKRRC